MAPSERGLTLAEHYAAGEDIGARRELVDGVLVVSPYASRRHALAAQRLSRLLDDACPPGLLVLGSPINVDRAPATNLQPDLSVVRTEDIDAPATSARPLLVVEILSPSTRRFDLTLKRQIYAEMGIASYWIVDIEVPSVTVLELAGSEYGEAGRSTGDEPVTVSQPFPLRFAAGQLVV